jgi:hypothetical protein
MDSFIEAIVPALDRKRPSVPIRAGPNAEFSLQNYANLVYFCHSENCVWFGRVPAEHACAREPGLRGRTTGVATCFGVKLSLMALISLVFSPGRL